MSLELSNRALKISLSPTSAMVARCADLKAKGIEILNFNIGEPDYDTPDHINKAIIDAINEGKTRYVDISGILPLRQAIKDKLLKDNNLVYDVSQISVATGAKQSLYNVLSVILNKGDEVIIPTPCWVSYEEMVKFNEAKCCFVPTLKNTFQLDIDAIKKNITAKTKAIILNNPNNPTGALYQKEDLEALAALAVEHQFYVISDEIYEKLLYDDAKTYSIASFNDDIYKQTITINGFAKAYAMTGYRIGYAAGPADIIKLVNNLQSHSTSNSTTPVQYGAIAALNGSQECVNEMVIEYAKRRQVSFALLSEIPEIKVAQVNGAFYIMIDIKAFFNKTYLDYKITNCDDMVFYLLDEAKIALVSGSAFQAPNHIRFSYSNSIDNITKGLKSLKEALAKLK